MLWGGKEKIGQWKGREKMESGKMFASLALWDGHCMHC